MTSDALVAGLISGVIAYSAARRAAFDRVTCLMQDLTSGEVGRARHLVGSLAYCAGSDLHECLALMGGSEGESPTVGHLREDLFKVLWALERTSAISRGFWRPGTGPELLLVRSVGHWVRWCNDPSKLAKVATLLAVDADDELVNLRRLAARWESLANKPPAIRVLHAAHSERAHSGCPRA